MERIRTLPYTQRLRRIFLLFAFALPLTAAVSPDYAARRDKLRAMLRKDVVVLFGAKESDDLHYAFFQEPNFFYLTGWQEPGAILLLTPAKAGDILFLPPRVPAEEKWTGRKLGPDDPNVRAVTEFTKVLPATSFETELKALLTTYPGIFTLPGDSKSPLLEKAAHGYATSDPRPFLARLRMEKSPEEIARIQRSTDASIDAHRAAWRTIHPGEYEYQLASTMVSTYESEGCQRSAYAPIVGSGPNSAILHYSRNSRRMDGGEVVVMDVAAECDNYASDITRTVPANGKFTARQREIYNVVLGAHRAAIAAVKPGMTLGRKTPNSLYQIAFDYMNTHGKDLHGEPLGKYFTHGLSHHVGLDVHDLEWVDGHLLRNASDPREPLKAGMVITIEPGLYIPEEYIGIRIEDVVLVTATGSKVLSAALPVDPDEIERAMAQRK
jgi:Xaa-Pro aminopeptidase